MIILPIYVKIKKKKDNLGVYMKRIKKITSIILSTLFLSACSFSIGTADTPENDVIKGYKQISVDEAKEIMRSEEGYIILDVRRADEFSNGHIPGAINVANETIGEEEIPELPNKSQLILVYCRSGRRSKEAAEKLVKLGYTNIVEFGGINDWTGEIVK